MFEKSNSDTHLASKGLNLSSHEYFIVHDNRGNGIFTVPFSKSGTGGRGGAWPPQYVNGTVSSRELL